MSRPKHRYLLCWVGMGEQLDLYHNYRKCDTMDDVVQCIANLSGDECDEHVYEDLRRLDQTQRLDVYPEKFHIFDVKTGNELTDGEYRQLAQRVMFQTRGTGE